MKTAIEDLQDSFKFSYEAFEPSRLEERQVTDFYHNNQYTADELEKLRRRGQPAETFNIIKLFARLLVGYYSTVVNTVTVSPQQQSDDMVARLLHDIVQYTFRDSHFESEGEKVKLDGILTGIMCVYEEVVDTGRRDEFGRPINRIRLSHVPAREIVMDPMSRLEDYSDARFIHRFKWVSEDYMRQILRKSHDNGKADEILGSLEAYANHVNQEDTEFENNYTDRFVGIYKQYDNYLLIHSVVVDNEGEVWSIFWCGEQEISRKKVTYRKVRFPYRIQRLHSSYKAEYYGLFRDVFESQRAINQAVLKIQSMVNSQKAFVQEGAVDNLDEFTDAFSRVSAVIPVRKLGGIRVENISAEAQQQYTIISKAFERIQRVLGINDSFLGMAYASDSGRKVKLQQNATTMSLRYVTVAIEQLYRLIGEDIVFLVQQFYTAHESLRITDDSTAQRWAEMNRPMQIFSGNFDQNGQPIFETKFEEVLDPENGKPLIDDGGRYVWAPIPDGETDIEFSEVDISIDAVPYSDEDEKAQLMLENVLQGQIGQALLQMNPAAFLEASALAVKGVRTKHSADVADLLSQTAQLVSKQPVMPQLEGSPGSGKSQQLKLPQNTNE